MIRTETDFQWVQAMLDSGYTFSGKSALSPDQLWYGDLIYEDRDGDMNHGDDDDMDFNGHTGTPAYNLGINLGFSWKGLDFNMTWAGAFGFWIIYNSDYYNASTMQSGYGLIDRVANDHYFYDPDNPGDARTNISGTYPRLTYGTALSNRASSEFLRIPRRLPEAQERAARLHSPGKNHTQILRAAAPVSSSQARTFSPSQVSRDSTLK